MSQFTYLGSNMQASEDIQEELMTETGMVTADLTHLKLHSVIKYLSCEDSGYKSSPDLAPLMYGLLNES